MKKGILLMLLLCFTVLVQAISPKTNTPALANYFVENKGQIKNQKQETNKDVLFLLHEKNLNVQLRASGFSYDLYEDNSVAGQLIAKSQKACVQKYHRIDIDFEGANPEVISRITELAEGKLICRSKENANESITLNQFEKVTYQNVYPNVDVEFLVSKGNFKYNIIIKPGADINKVRLKIKGSNNLKLSNEGNIIIGSAFGNLEERIPLSYELSPNGKQGKTIKAVFRKLGSNLFGLNADEYDESKTLLIDPMIWSTYYGGASAENTHGLCIDKSNNIYISGQTASNSNIATSGAYQSTLGGGYDAFLAKFNQAGTLLWSTYYGGSGFDEINEIAVDNDGNIVATGDTYSTSGIATNGSYQSTLPGIASGFVAKFSPSGNIIYGTYYGGTGTDAFYGICVDKQNNIIVIGSSNSVTHVLSYPNIHQSTIAGQTDIIIVRFSSSGTPVWATYYGGTLNDNAYGVCTDGNSNIYVTGNTFSASGLNSPGCYQSANAGMSDAYAAKFDSTGRLIFGTFYGGSASDFASEMTIDPEGNLIIVGYSSSTSGVATAGAYKTTLSGSGYDGMLLKMDTAGHQLWCTYYGGTGTENILNVCTDGLSNIYFSGNTTSATDIASPGAPQTIRWGTGDAMVVSFDKTGAQLFGSYFGGNASNDEISNILVDGASNLFCLGNTSSDSGIATIGAYQISRKGNTDAFLLKYSLSLSPPDTNITNNIIPSDQGYCIGSTVQDLIGAVPTGATGVYTYLWLFSASGFPGTYSIAPGVSTGVNYSPGGITTNSYYRRIVYSGTKSDTSNRCGIYFGTQLDGSFSVNKSIQCLKDNVFIFTDLTQSAVPITHEWDFGNGTKGNKQIETVTYSAGKINNLKVRLISSLNGACGDTNYTTVYIIPSPVAKTISGSALVTKGQTVMYSVPASNGSSYEWIFGNGTGRSTINTINIKWTQDGTTQLKMVETNGGGCMGDTSTLDVTISKPTASEEFQSLENISIYPNPSIEGLFYFEGFKDIQASLTLFDMAGGKIYNGLQTLSEPVDLRGQPSGIYILQLADMDENTKFFRLQVLH